MKPPWLIKVHDGGASHQFWASFKQILSFSTLNFITQKKLPKSVALMALRFSKGNPLKKWLTFLD